MTDPFLATNDFEIEQQHLRDRMTTIALYQNLDFLLYQQFERRKEERSISFFNDGQDAGELNKESLTYELSDSEVKELEEKSSIGFRSKINRIYNDIHSDLRAFDLLFNGGEHDYELIELYTYFIYLIQFFYLNHKPKHEIIGLPKKTRYRITSLNKKLVQELIKELEWRVQRLNHFDRFGYAPDDEELKLWVSAIYKEGINLLNKKRFEENSYEIYKLMVPIFIEPISFKDFCNLFHSGGAIFPHKISWQKPLNSLRYFIKTLQDKGKTSKKNNFRVAEEIFIHEGKVINNLTNNNSSSNEAFKLDEIVELF